LVVDLQVEGIWMALTQRDEFAAYLGQHGSNVSLLTAELTSRATRLRADNPIM
jgi:ABC-type transporter MlaC component